MDASEKLLYRVGAMVLSVLFLIDGVVNITRGEVFFGVCMIASSVFAAALAEKVRRS